MSKIKIAHILHSLGGVDISVRLITENINNNSFENVVIHGQHDTKKVFTNSNNNPVKNYPTSIVREISPLKDLRAVCQIYEILKKERPNIIHAHSAKGGVIGRIVGKIFKINVLYTPQAFSYLSAESKRKKKIYLTIEKFFAFKNSYVLASSNSEKERAISEVGYPKERVLLFNNSIKPITELINLQSETLQSGDYICTVGRPSFQKNIELMIRVLAEVNKVKKIHLVVMGVGLHLHDNLVKVEKLIDDLNMNNNVTLLKWTERDDVFHIIKKSKFYISTARYEGLPYSIIESFALGKPAVVSDCDGNKDLVKDGYNGFIVKNENIIEYRDKIVNLLTNDELLEELSVNALKSFYENYNIVKNIKYLEEIYSNYAKRDE